MSRRADVSMRRHGFFGKGCYSPIHNPEAGPRRDPSSAAIQAKRMWCLSRGQGRGAVSQAMKLPVSNLLTN
jgi:hypothetical protein